MDTTRWTKIQTLFEQVIQIPEEKRHTFLKSHCSNDKQLLDEIISLLEADNNVHDLLQGLAIDTFNIQGSEKLKADSKIGPYSIIKEIAVGGMGRVYLARRSDGHFEQEVALKIIKKGMDSEQVVKRFAREKQILAQLNHPNIAQLMDAGLMEDGRPWISLEYIDGMPITEYCDQKRLSVHRRLKLFQNVCETVSYAHRNLVIHRDLKPSNIMVTEDGHIKLLDFGISRILESDNENHITLTGQFLLTPEYAAPEQFTSKTVSISTDIYQLGIVFFELLNGKRPYQFDDLTPVEIHNNILRNKPKTLSDIDKLELQKICHVRGTNPPVLKKVLNSDLNFICQKALRKEPELRYLTVDEFKNDINRFLKFRPVSARQGSLLYGFKKFVQRHKKVFSISIAFILLIFLTVGYYTIQVTKERDRVQAEAQKAQQVSNFLTEVFKVADPYESRGEEVTARELLDLGAERIKKELVDQPETQAALMQTVGEVYLNMGLIYKAEPLLKKSLETRRKLFGNYNADVSQSLSLLGNLFYEKGQYDSSEIYTREKLDISRELYGEVHPDVAQGYNDLAWIVSEKGNYTLADSLNRRALHIRQEIFGDEHISVAESYNNLGSTQYGLGKLDEAGDYFDKALNMRLKLLGADHPLIAQTYGNRALIYEEKEEFKKADSIYIKALDLNKKLFGESSPQVAWTYQDLSRLSGRQGDYKKAVKLIRESIDIRISTLGEDHILVAYSKDYLADAFYKLQELDSAQTYYKESIDIYRNADSTSWVYMASPLKGMGSVLLQKGEYKKAEQYFREALKLREDNLPPGNFVIARAKTSLADCLVKMKKYQEAEELLLSAFNIYKDLEGQYNSSRNQTLHSLLNLYNTWPGKKDESVKYSVMLNQSAD